MRNKRDVSKHIKERIVRVGQLISSLRKEKGLTREKLAYGVGISKSYLGYIENGVSNPTLETLFLIAEGLDIEPEALLR